MRKLFSLVLAALIALTPIIACGEAYEYTVSLNLDIEKLLPVISSLEDAIPEEYAGMTESILEVIDGVGLTLIAQEDACRISLIHGSSEIADASFNRSGDSLILSSTLFSDYALSFDFEMNETQTVDPAKLVAALLGAAQAAKQWFDALEPDVAYGSFTADAYDGGTKCTTYMVTDSDLAGVVKSLLNDDVKECIAAIADEDALERLTAVNDQVADEDVHSYILRVVENENGFLGFSLTVFREVAQIGTVSLGLHDQQARLVVGLGLDEQNYWYDLSISRTTRNKTIYLKGKATEYLAARDETFAFASAANEAKAQIDWSCRLVPSGNRTVFEAEYLNSLDNSGFGMRGTFELNPFVLDAEIFDLSNALLVNLYVRPAEAIAPLAEGLTYYGIEELNDPNLSGKIMQDVASHLLVKLIKVLPIDLVMNLMPLLTQ